jgi:hypothetical protein
MKEISTHLSEIVNSSSAQMKKLSEQDWEYRMAPGKWSRKEILGHLIDSAANNHQRFVRAQYGDKTPISYDGNAWVRVEKHNDIPAANLIGLWAFYNLHLSHIISNIPKEKYSTLFNADASEPKTLEWLVQDYMHHLVHHLKQILP